MRIWNSRTRSDYNRTFKLSASASCSLFKVCAILKSADHGLGRLNIHPSATQILNKTFDQRLFVLVQAGLIHKSPISFVDRERFTFIDHAVIAPVPCNQSQLREVSESYHICFLILPGTLFSAPHFNGRYCGAAWKGAREDFSGCRGRQALIQPPPQADILIRG